MFSGIAEDRFGQLTPQEERLLDNVKKAFYESDDLYQQNRPEDCLAPMCIAIDAAKTLRRLLRGEDTSPTYNAQRFKEFIDLEVPPSERGGLRVTLVNARSSEPRDYSFSALVYAIRCMVHENENLNVVEGVDYYILLDWGQTAGAAGATAGQVRRCPPNVAGVIDNGRMILNGHLIWGRLREVMAKFITGIDSLVGFAKGATSGSITIRPPLGSVRPAAHRRE